MDSANLTSPKKILIVEDNKPYLNTLLTEFKLSGFDVAASSGGIGVLEKAKKEMPDVILLDIILPGKTGLTIIKELKSDEETKDIPIIALSNFGGKKNEKKVMAMGATAFFEKSDVPPLKLVNQVKILCP